MGIIKVDDGVLWKNTDYDQYGLQLDLVSATSATLPFNGMNGKKLLILVFSWASSSNYTYNRFDGATCVGGTLTKVANLLNGSARVAGTFYNLEVTSDECTVTSPQVAFVKAFEAI